MSRCVGHAPDTGKRCEMEAAPGNVRCNHCGRRASEERFRFEGWMQAVSRAMEAGYGLHPDDLPDCTYRDWYHSGMTAEEAARQVMALFLDA